MSERDSPESGQQYSDDELLEVLKLLQATLDRAPTVRDVRANPDLPDVSTFEKRFGSWRKALDAAGIEGAHNRSDETILRQLAFLAMCLGRPPTKREVDASRNVASSGLYTNRFGSFSNAVRLSEQYIVPMSDPESET